jgi:YggT family protein
MLYSILSFVLDVVAGLVGGACLLRCYMQWLRVPFGNPIGQFVLAVTNWLVLPLRRVVTVRWRWDIASLVGALIAELAQYTILWVIAGLFTGVLGPAWTILPILAILGLVRLVISGLTGLVMVYAVLSWVQPGRSLLSDTLERLCLPVLTPVRRRLPLLGGVDLSPLVLLVLLQIAAMVLGSIQLSLLH